MNIKNIILAATVVLMITSCGKKKDQQASSPNVTQINNSNSALTDAQKKFTFHKEGFIATYVSEEFTFDIKQCSDLLLNYIDQTNNTFKYGYLYGIKEDGSKTKIDPNVKALFHTSLSTTDFIVTEDCNTMIITDDGIKQNLGLTFPSFENTNGDIVFHDGKILRRATNTFDHLQINSRSITVYEGVGNLAIANTDAGMLVINTVTGARLSFGAFLPTISVNKNNRSVISGKLYKEDTLEEIPLATNEYTNYIFSDFTASNDAFYTTAYEKSYIVGENRTIKILKINNNDKFEVFSEFVITKDSPIYSEYFDKIKFNDNSFLLTLSKNIYIFDFNSKTLTEKPIFSSQTAKSIYTKKVNHFYEVEVTDQNDIRNLYLLNPSTFKMTLLPQELNRLYYSIL